MKKRLNLIAMIIQTVSCTLLCIPGMYEAGDISRYFFWGRNFSFLSMINDGYVKRVDVLGTFVFMVLVTIFLYYTFFCDNKKTKRFISIIFVILQICLPITQIVLYLLSSIKSVNGVPGSKFHFEVSTLFYIEMILLALVAFLSIYSILKKSDSIEDD